MPRCSSARRPTTSCGGSSRCPPAAPAASSSASLIDLVVDEVADHDAALPLVSAALADVWERRDGDTLTAARYVEIGGIAAAVERLGERAVRASRRRATASAT